MKKVVFIVPVLSDSHYKNRILEFVENGYEVEVFGFERKNRQKSYELPYDFTILGETENRGHISRVKTYIKTFKQFKKKYIGDNVYYYLCGLDVALFFLLLNPGVPFIYEECDLMHTYTPIKGILEFIDKKIIKNSLITISTSEGFNQYHWGNNIPDTVCLVPNKLNADILNCKILGKKQANPANLQVGFVGVPRPQMDFFIRTFCQKFPQHTFHLFGGPLPHEFVAFKQYSNFMDHGYFQNPVDLPNIYASIDVVLCTYDNRFENPRYAEPNKLYEAIYFETPIIVSSNTFLSKKVTNLDIGYVLDPFNEDEIIRFFKSIDVADLKLKALACRKICKNDLININSHLFRKLATAIS